MRSSSSEDRGSDPLDPLRREIDEQLAKLKMELEEVDKRIGERKPALAELQRRLIAFLQTYRLPEEVEKAVKARVLEIDVLLDAELLTPRITEKLEAIRQELEAIKPHADVKKIK